MAEQTAIDYESLEWKDDASGGTPIDAAALNRMEGGIADACAGVDELRTRRLPTYVVAQDGDTATQDVYSDDILGPCLILDLATRTTYYETGGDEDGHRKELVSGADVDEIRDSVSQLRPRGRLPVERVEPHRHSPRGVSPRARQDRAFGVRPSDGSREDPRQLQRVVHRHDRRPGGRRGAGLDAGRDERRLTDERSGLLRRRGLAGDGAETEDAWR